MKKILIMSLIFAISLSFATSLLAQEVDESNVLEIEEEVLSEVVPEDLEISKPGTFSWLNRFVRNVRIRFTRDEVKKSELELENASEDLYKAKEKIRKNPNDEKLQERISQMSEKYKAHIEKINSRLEKEKEKNPDNEKLKSFLDKYSQHQIKHMEVLKNVENRVSAEIAEKIKARRQEHLQNFGENMEKLQNKEEFKNSLHKVLQEKNKGEQSQLHRVEILDELQEKVPSVKANVQEVKNKNWQKVQNLKNKQHTIKAKTKSVIEKHKSIRNNEIEK